MLYFHDAHEYRARACMAWGEMEPVGSYWDDTRDIDAGYCIDALERCPAGSTRRIDPPDGTPFCAAVYAWPRLF
jgi:hypothetical protein